MADFECAAGLPQVAKRCRPRFDKLHDPLSLDCQIWARKAGNDLEG